jgi:hypothetical protein
MLPDENHFRRDINRGFEVGRLYPAKKRKTRAVAASARWPGRRTDGTSAIKNSDHYCFSQKTLRDNADYYAFGRCAARRV